MQVKSRVKLNMAKIRQLSRAQIQALEMTTEALHTEVIQAQVIPFDKGNLQNESTFVDNSESDQGHSALISNTPYARRLYFHPEYHFKTHENPNAKGEWYKDYVPGGKHEKFAPEAFKKFYKLCGGV